MRNLLLAAAMLGSLVLASAASAADAQRSVTGPQGETATRERSITRTAPGQWSGQGTVTGRQGGTATRSGSVRRGW